MACQCQLAPARALRSQASCAEGSAAIMMMHASVCLSEPDMATAGWLASGRVPSHSPQLSYQVLRVPVLLATLNPNFTVRRGTSASPPGELGLESPQELDEDVNRPLGDAVEQTDAQA
jgi:hypothetical protein